MYTYLPLTKVDTHPFYMYNRVKTNNEVTTNNRKYINLMLMSVYAFIGHRNMFQKGELI